MSLRLTLHLSLLMLSCTSAENLLSAIFSTLHETTADITSSWNLTHSWNLTEMSWYNNASENVNFLCSADLMTCTLYCSYAFPQPCASHFLSVYQKLTRLYSHIHHTPLSLSHCLSVWMRVCVRVCVLSPPLICSTQLFSGMFQLLFIFCGFGYININNCYEVWVCVSSLVLCSFRNSQKGNDQKCIFYDQGQ